MKKIHATTKRNPVLRQHQSEALSVVRKLIKKGEGKGRIVLPTGTGKTRIEAETVCDITKLTEILEWPGVFVVLSPRILLAYQQLNDFITIIGQNGYRMAYHVVNSGGLDSADYERKLLRMGFDHPEEIDSTTTATAIIDKIRSSQKNNIPLVVFSTYHSAYRVQSAADQAEIQIRAYLFDEAQYCVTSGKFQNVPDFDADFKFFFTATEKITNANDGLGMNNESKFGKLLFTEKPKNSH